MAILGHPLYAKAYDMADGEPEFARLKQLLLDHGVTIVMAGDTHDFEYYAEPARAGKPAVHYFVNGGGGAYLSLGTALDWPAKPPTRRVGVLSATRRARRQDGCADALVEAAGLVVDEATHHAWPFSSEWLSALFDYNVAPFFQSFVEVRVGAVRESRACCGRTACTAGCAGATSPVRQA